MRQTLSQFTCKPTFACTATSDAVGRAISDQSALQQFGADWDEGCLRAGSFKLTSAPATCGDRSSARKNDFDFGELAKLGIDLD